MLAISVTLAFQSKIKTFINAKCALGFMAKQEGLKRKLDPSEVALAKKNWCFLRAGPNLPYTKQERADFLKEYANCTEVMDYVKITQQPLKESDGTYQRR